jgi:ABC-type uncharacterized transport system substrate-binding protein
MFDMRRRDLITLLGGAAAWPLAAGAQQGGPVIGFFDWGRPLPNGRAVTAFRQGLAEAGYIEGRNVAIEYRWAEGQYERLPELAADLVQHQAAVIVATGALGTAMAAKAATSTIPIVILAGGDPVKYGLAASLYRPGSNVTGMTFITTELAGKRLDLLREMAPQATKVAYLSGGPRFLRFEDEQRNILEAARAFGREVIVAEATSDRDIEAAFATIAERQAAALIVGVVPHFASNGDRIVALAQRHKIPAIYPFRSYAVRGGLMSYGADIVGAFRRVGVEYVGRILKGEKASDLPVQTPTKYELVVNLKTAKALGLDVPATLLALADEVIE